MRVKGPEKIGRFQEARCRNAAGDFRSACSLADLPTPGSVFRHRSGPVSRGADPNRPSPLNLRRTEQCQPVQLRSSLGTVWSGTRPRSTSNRHPRGREGAAHNALLHAQEETTGSAPLGYSAQHLAGRARAQFPSPFSPLTPPPPRPLLTWMISQRQIWCCSVGSRRVVL